MSGDFQKGFLRAVLENIAENDIDEFVIIDELDGDANGPRHAALMIGLLRFAFDETVGLFDPMVQPLGECFAFQRKEMRLEGKRTGILHGAELGRAPTDEILIVLRPIVARIGTADIGGEIEELLHRQQFAHIVDFLIEANRDSVRRRLQVDFGLKFCDRFCNGW